MKKRRRNIFIVCSTLILILLLNVNVFAHPSSYSSGMYDDASTYDSYSGHPFTVSGYIDDSTDLVLTTTVCPSIYPDQLTPLDYSSNSMDQVSFGSSYTSVYSQFYNFEGNINFISQFPVGIFASRFDLNSDQYMSTLDRITFEARDFYYYISPDFTSMDDGDDNSYIQFSLDLGVLGDTVYEFEEAPTFEMYYCFGGHPDTAEERLYYACDAEDQAYKVKFFPDDDFIFSTLEERPEGYLIYVEYACLTLDLYSDNYYNFNFNNCIYFTDFYDYRSFDVSSYVEPVSPINPGVFRDYTSWLGTAVGGFLDLQLVDGFTLGGILMVLIAFLITMWFLKVFAGG